MRFVNRISSRFQSNHQRGYFWRKRIIKSGGTKSRAVPLSATDVPGPDASQAAGPPWMVATRIRIGIAQINLNAVLPRSRFRSG